MRDWALVAMLERRKIAIVAAIAAVASAKGRGAPSGAPSAADAQKKKVTDELMNWVKDVDPTKAPVKSYSEFLSSSVYRVEGHAMFSYFDVKGDQVDAFLAGASCCIRNEEHKIQSSKYKPARDETFVKLEKYHHALAGDVVNLGRCRSASLASNTSATSLDYLEYLASQATQRAYYVLRDVKNHPENMGEATLKHRLERAMELKKHKLGLKEDGDDWFSSEEQKKDDAALESEAAALPKKRGKRKGKLDLDAETIKTSDKAIKAAGGPRDKGKHSRLRASSAPRAQLLGPAKVGDDTTVGPFLAALVVILVLLGAAYNFFLAPKPVGVKYVPR